MWKTLKSCFLNIFKVISEEKMLEISITEHWINTISFHHWIKILYKYSTVGKGCFWLFCCCCLFLFFLFCLDKSDFGTDLYVSASEGALLLRAEVLPPLQSTGPSAALQTLRLKEQSHSSQRPRAPCWVLQQPRILPTSGLKVH